MGNVSEFIIQHHQDDANLCVVLPGRRAGLFLRQEITSRINTPIWSPTIISIEDLFLKLSGLEKADDAELLLTLYDIVKRTPGHTDEPFDGFCKWAPALLSDINDVDAWLADPKQLFTNLSEIKIIEHWSLGESVLTDFQKKYLKFWSNISLWYYQLRDAMLKKNKGWSGLIYRQVAENIPDCIAKSNWSHFVFAGFNALNNAEEKLFATLVKSNKADILWDSDSYYLDDKVNVAGKFLRTYKETLFTNNSRHNRPFVNTNNTLATQKKNFTLVAAARSVSQARSASAYLENEGENFLPDETAIVLADEQLLMPMLNAIPSRFPDVNITMGYPMRNTPVYTLLHILFSLQESAAHFKVKSSDGSVKFYHHDIIRLFRHPYIIACVSKPARLLKYIQEIGRKNLTFVSLNQLLSLSNDQSEIGIEQLFSPWNTANDSITGLRNFAERMRIAFSKNEQSHQLDIEYVYQLHLALNRVSSLFEEWPGFNEVSAVKNLLIQQFGSMSVPFSGEPLHGLQIMGMLETRALDFKNLIIVSANEGILPGASSRHSFIMHDLRKAFGLPMYNDKESVSAYHFYRSLQRAENICLIYNTDQDGFGSKEKSRFITQLQYELPKVNALATFRSIIAGAELSPATSTDEISIQSSDEIVALIMRKSEKGFSPSMINTYRECKLRFYLRYVAGLSESDTVEESADTNTLGTIVHRAMELLYLPYLNTPLEVSHLTMMKTKIDKVWNEAFKEKFAQEGANEGRNLLAGTIARRYISKYLDREIKRITSNNLQSVTSTILALEKVMQVKCTIDQTQITFSGTADRIERTGNIVQLTDYKTGSVEQKDVTLKNWTEFSESEKKGKAFQLMLYAWLYLKGEDETAIVQPGIISFRMLTKGFMNLQTPEGDHLTINKLAEFEKSLFAVTTEMISTSTVFDQTIDIAKCKVCDFNSICRRDASY